VSASTLKLWIESNRYPKDWYDKATSWKSMRKAFVTDEGGIKRFAKFAPLVSIAELAAWV